MIEEAVEPTPDGGIVFKPAAQMGVTRLGAGHRHALMRPHCPAAHHRVGHFGVELQTPRRLTDAKGLMAKIFALGERLAAFGEVEPAFAVPLIDGAWPWRAQVFD